MATYFRHFRVYGKYLGSAQEHIRFIHGEAQEPVPYMMFCPACGEIWAEMAVVNSSAEWRIIGGYCEKHGKSRYAIAGSLMLQWEPELTAILPDEVIKREFALHLRLWDKENDQLDRV
jgi:hypothetical protein